MMHVLYISVGGEDRIACFRRSTLTGSLSHLADAPVGGRPGALCLLSGVGGHSRQQRLFCACSRSSSGSEEPQGGIATLAVDEVSGGLTEIGWVPAAFNEAPCYLATDPTGRWLLTAHYSIGCCAVHPIADGLAGAASQEVAKEGSGRAAMGEGVDTQWGRRLGLTLRWCSWPTAPCET